MFLAEVFIKLISIWCRINYYSHTHACMHAYIRTFIHTHIHTHTHTHTHTHVHTYTHIYTHTCKSVQTHTQTHAHTDTHIKTHKYTHICMYTHTYSICTHRYDIPHRVTPCCVQLAINTTGSNNPVSMTTGELHPLTNPLTANTQSIVYWLNGRTISYRWA